MLLRLRGLLLTTTSAVVEATQAISSMLETYAILSMPLLSTMSNTVLQLPYQAGWQDLKDLFRAAGNISRADINIGMDGRPKGSGTVVFETAKDAQQAICAYSRLPPLTLCNTDILLQQCTTALTGTVASSKFERIAMLA